MTIVNNSDLFSLPTQSWYSIFNNRNISPEESLVLSLKFVEVLAACHNHMTVTVPLGVGQQYSLLESQLFSFLYKVENGDLFISCQERKYLVPGGNVLESPSRICSASPGGSG